MTGIEENFWCLTCGFPSDIVLDDDGTSEEEANDAHMEQDGAHRANWISNEDGSSSPDERRSILDIDQEW